MMGLSPYVPPGFLSETEDCLIASMLADPVDVIPKVRASCPPAAFVTQPGYRGLVGAIYAAHDDGEAPDGPALLKRLDSTKGTQELVEKALASANSMLAATYSADNYAQVLNEAHACRLALKHLPKLDAAARRGCFADVQAAVETLAGDVTRAYCPNEGATGEEAADRATQRIEQFGDQAISTGFGQLDWLTDGGIRPGDYWIVGARPNVGKTALALAIARHQIKAGKVAVIVTTEMSDEQLMDRFIVAETGLPPRKVRRRQLTAEDWTRYQECLARLGPNLRMFETCRGVDTPAKIGGVLARLKAQLGDGLGVCVVDYLQNLEVGGRVTEETPRISAISRGLQRVARAVQVPLLVLSQLNRAAEYRAAKRPGLADLRQSGQIEQDADLVGLLWRPRQAGFDDAPEGMTMLFVDKHRHGQVGDVHLVWRPDRVTFGQAEQHWVWTPRRSSRG